MENAGPEETWPPPPAAPPPAAPPPAAPPSKRPAIWAWPLILISVAAIVFAPRLLPRAAEITEVEDYAANLVVLQIQARIIVAASAIDSVQGSKELETLEVMATNDGAVAALAALHVFVDPKGKGPEKAGGILDRRIESGVANEEYLDRIRTALAEGVTEEERESFRVNLGTFADFLPAPGTPMTWPKREEIRSRSFVTLIVVAATVVSAIVFGGLGLILLCTGIFKYGNRSLIPAKVGHPEAGPALLEGFAVFLFLLFLAQVAGWMLHWSVQFAFMIAGLAAVVVWPRWRTGLPWRELRRAFGLHRGKGLLRELFSGVVGYLMILPLAGIGLILTMILSSIIEAVRGGPSPAPSHPIMGMMEGGWIALVFVFFLASVLAPVVEEITFRGAFFGALRNRWSFAASGLVTGLIFAVIHPQGFVAIPPLMAVGFGLALIREWRGSLIAPMTAHAINNSVLLAGALLMLS